MSGLWTIYSREMKMMALSPVAYALLAVWTFLSGLSFTLFCGVVAQRSIMAGGAPESPLTYYFGNTLLFYIPVFVVVPLVTMRLIAEERARGTLETLLTAPVDELGVVLGKYFAALTFWIVLQVPSLFFVWIVSGYGDVDLGQIGAAYVGLFGIGLYYMAIGTAASAASPNQLMAAITTTFLLVGLFLIGLGGYVVEDYRDVFAYLSIWGHMEAFSQGIIDTRFLVFDASLALVALAFAVGVLSARRVSAGAPQAGRPVAAERASS